MAKRASSQSKKINGWSLRVLFAVSAICAAVGFVWYAYFFVQDGFRTAEWLPATATVSMPKVNLDGDGWSTGAVAFLLQQYRVDFILHYTAQGVDVSHTARVGRFSSWRARNLAANELADGAEIAIKYSPNDPRLAAIVQPKNEPWFSYLFLCVAAMALSVFLIKRASSKKI